MFAKVQVLWVVVKIYMEMHISMNIYIEKCLCALNGRSSRQGTETMQNN